MAFFCAVERAVFCVFLGVQLSVQVAFVRSALCQVTLHRITIRPAVFVCMYVSDVHVDCSCSQHVFFVVLQPFASKAECLALNLPTGLLPRYFCVS